MTNTGTFKPKHEEHFFESKESFFQYIEGQDPMDEFKPEKREINWSSIEKNCQECGTKFVATHPAMMYCSEHRLEETEEEAETTSRTDSTTHYEPKAKSCSDCGRQFQATKPAMKYCKDCRPTGGKLLHPESSE